jgi:hypothetical protein
LEFYLFVVDLDHASAELNTNCKIMEGLETLICELQKQAGLADA